MSPLAIARNVDRVRRRRINGCGPPRRVLRCLRSLRPRRCGAPVGDAVMTWRREVDLSGVIRRKDAEELVRRLNGMEKTVPASARREWSVSRPTTKFYTNSFFYFNNTASS